MLVPYAASIPRWHRLRALRQGSLSLHQKSGRNNGAFDCQVGAFQVEAYCDADFANSEDRRSISGFLVMFLGCCLSARSRKQTMVTLSTAEAEYIALCDLVKELLWYIELLEELGFPQRSIVVHCGNQSAIAIAKNPGHHERTKHISVKYHFVCVIKWRRDESN
ncbi:Aste57867_20219 [Aphanomyces stellatus]|uniref:Aste57867_20219 protein n=1 Tax=Aphanomyces stellatus TaxID=120398 RepID=A0A485LJ64_9STRA|nr:hypothetical protein As57867_020153 [Aphanomyces stellatus]VFT96912.1 Aste57867_20219 [Aphanomyces stellatus]